MNVAAFFDVDGTLVPPPSLEKRFLRYLRWRGFVGWKNFARCAAPLLDELSSSFFGGEWDGLECVAAQCKAYLAGVPLSAMDAWLAWLARHPIELFPEALQRVNWHVQQGHRIFLLSGTLEPLAMAIARQFSVPVQVCATQLETENGRYTGRVLGAAVCGPEKARAMERLAEEFSLDLGRSYAYGDSFADRWMLLQAGHAAVVQSAEKLSWRLANLARQRGWPIFRWGAAHPRKRNIQCLSSGFAEERDSTPRILCAEAKTR